LRGPLESINKVFHLEDGFGVKRKTARFQLFARKSEDYLFKIVNQN